MKILWAPWRMSYLQGNAQPDGVPSGGPGSAERADAGLTAAQVRAEYGAGEPGCIFCDKPRQARDEANLIVWRGHRAYALLNLYPYNNGHLMVVPYQHANTLEALPLEAATELMALSQRAITALRDLYNPHAFNLGMNLGAAAGAGIAGHLHLHIVPRWNADTNFMTVTGDTRVIPEDLGVTWQRLVAWSSGQVVK
jgi:ATP adenylyltransferase